MRLTRKAESRGLAPSGLDRKLIRGTLVHSDDRLDGDLEVLLLATEDDSLVRDGEGAKVSDRPLLIRHPAADRLANSIAQPLGRCAHRFSVSLRRSPHMQRVSSGSVATRSLTTGAAALVASCHRTTIRGQSNGASSRPPGLTSTSATVNRSRWTHQASASRSAASRREGAGRFPAPPGHRESVRTALFC